MNISQDMNTERLYELDVNGQEEAISLQGEPRFSYVSEEVDEQRIRQVLQGGMRWEWRG